MAHGDTTRVEGVKIVMLKGEKGNTGYPTEEQVALALAEMGDTLVNPWMEAHGDEAVGAWLDEHPEATTTVQDGSLTEPKFSDALKLKAIKDYATPEMFGAKGDGIADDHDAIATAIASSDLVLCKGNYFISSPILVGSGKSVFITGKITSSSDAIYVNGYGTKIIANEINASETCIKIANRASCEHCFFQLYKLTGKNGISYEGESWAQYNTFIGGKLECSEHCIHIVHPADSVGWFNENYFHDIKCGGDALYGVYVINASTNKGMLNGNRFINIGFENSNNAVYLNNVSFFSFNNIRIQEIRNNNVLVLEGNNEYVEFHTTDLLKLEKIDVSLNTGDNNQIIAPIVFNEGSGMTYHAYVDKSVITYNLRRSRLLNVVSDVTMDINSTVFTELPLYDVFTFRDTSAKRTLTLSPQYGVKGINVIKLVVVGTGVSLFIKDSQGHTVFNKDNAQAGSYILYSDGTGYWGGGRLA